jgi:hypothetical protein
VPAVVCLQEIITVTPYDKHLQQQPAQDSDQQATPVHIQTEEDLQLPLLQQQQQQQADTGLTQQQQQQQHEQSPTPGKQGLVGRLSSQRLPLSSFGRSKGSKAKSSSTNEAGKSSKGASSVQQELPLDTECAEQLVKVQLRVLTAAGEAAAAAGDQQQLVQLLLQVQSPVESQPATPSKASAGSSSSSSKLLGAGADAVKGLLQGLQHSAAAGLHQGAAAGQELTDAVTAAGEAVMGAMITQPFAAVKGFAARAGGSRQGPPAGTQDSSGSSKAATVQQGGTPDSTAAAGASSRRLAGLFSKRHGSAAAPAEDTEDSDKQGSAAAAAATAAAHTGDAPRGDEQLLHVQLLTSADPSNSSPVQLVIAPVGAAAAAAAGPVSRATSSSAPSWHSTKGLLGKFKRGSSKDSVASQQGTSAAAGDDEAASGADDVLEGDMWSVMTRLKQGGGGKAAKHAAATAASPTAAAAEAAAAAAAQQQDGLQLLQQLLDTCAQVQLAAAASKGALGDECEPLLLLVALIQQALNHGLRNTQAAAAAAAAAARDDDGSAGSKAAAAARDVLGGWLPRQDVTAFGVSCFFVALTCLSNRMQQTRVEDSSPGIPATAPAE